MSDLEIGKLVEELREHVRYQYMPARCRDVMEQAASTLERLAGGKEEHSPSRDLSPRADIALDGARIREVLAEGDGLWMSCSGCLELEDGQNVHGYPHSKVLGCTLGSGCSECGGLGAVWDTTDWSAMGAELAAEISSAKSDLGDSSRDDLEDRRNAELEAKSSLPHPPAEKETEGG